MKNKKIIYILLVSLITLSSNMSFSVQASTKKSTTEIEKQAIELASKNMNWNNVKTKNIKEVYDFNNNLIAYSIDLENESNSSKGYELINSNNTNEVIEFSDEKISPFNKLSKDDIPIYSGFFNYFYKDESGQYIELKSNKEFSKENSVELEEMNNQNRFNIYNKHTKNFYKNFNSNNSNINNSQTNAKEKILYDVSDEFWYKGCTPTALGMILEYDFYDNTPEFKPLVDILAPAIGTDKNGWTTIGDNIVNGVKETMKKFGVDNVSVVIDGQGRDQSTYAEYIKEINENHPVDVGLNNSKITSPGYPNGYGNHEATGVGYKYTNNQQFLIVHDSTMSGNVYIDFNSPLLGVNQWIYIH